MHETTEDKYFRFHNGIILKSIEDFANWMQDVLQGKYLQYYEFHIKNNGNDFANWIRDVFFEQKLAEDIRASKTPEEVYEKLLIYLNTQSEEAASEDKVLDDKLDSNVGVDSNEKPSFIETSESMLEKMNKIKTNRDSK